MIYSYNLSGIWDFSMAQMPKGKIPPAFSDTIYLPGTASAAKKGTPHHERTQWHMTDPYAQEGQLWFRRSIYIPPAYIGNPMQILLERTRLSTLWINGQQVGAQDSLCTPHLYDITAYADKPLLEITICTENTGYPISGGHMTSPDTQTNWNGITGRLALLIHAPVYVDDVQAYPDPAAHTVRLDMALHGAQEALFTAEGTVRERNECDVIPPFSQTICADENGRASVTIPLGDTIYPWDEYQTALYELNYCIDGKDRDSVCFGLCDFRAQGRQFVVNGAPVFLRGKHDGMVFPMTGYAPTDPAQWTEIFRRAKAYGINHYRFHTCCPPEAAFAAADLAGIYLEPELPFWGTLAAPGEPEYHKAQQDYLLKEGERILRTFGNHPSFVMFSLGNELWGNPAHIAGILRHYRRLDPRPLYTQGSNNFQHMPRTMPEEDFFVGVRLGKERLLRGSYGNCDLPLGHIQAEAPNAYHCYDEAVSPSAESRNDASQTQIEIQYGTGVKTVSAADTDEIAELHKPIVTHEVGQYAVFPHFSEMEKYTGVIKPYNLALIQERLMQKGLAGEAEDFFRASGALAADCYKREIEAAMRSESIAGFQLLDLQDFPGQGTALVGILDAFMDSKGLIEPETWRGFCADTVLLARFKSFVLYTGEIFRADIFLRTTNPQIPETIRVLVEMHTPEKRLHSEYFTLQTRPGLQTIRILSIPLPEVSAPTPLKLTLCIEDSDCSNSYDLMLYPPMTAASLPALHQPPADMPRLPAFYCTDFWNYPMFRNICESMQKPPAVGTMGLLIDTTHPALAGFPCKFFTTPQWYTILQHTDCIILDGEEITPIVQMIDNFDRAHRLGILYEKTTDGEKELFCSIRFGELEDCPEAMWLLKSITDYLTDK